MTASRLPAARAAPYSSFALRISASAVAGVRTSPAPCPAAAARSGTGRTKKPTTPVTAASTNTMPPARYLWKDMMGTPVSPADWTGPNGGPDPSPARRIRTSDDEMLPALHSEDDLADDRQGVDAIGVDRDAGLGAGRQVQGGDVLAVLERHRDAALLVLVRGLQEFSARQDLALRDDGEDALDLHLERLA